MSKKKDTFTRQIGEALEGCGQSRYVVSKATGLTQSTLSRLVSGKGWIGKEGMDTLAEYLGLSVTVKQKGR